MNREVTLMFKNTTSVLDEAICRNIALPQHLNKSFRKFVADLNAVARRHFEYHLPEYHNQSLASIAASPAPAPAKNQRIGSRAPQRQPASRTPAVPSKATKPTLRKAQPAKVREDYRLLIRVAEGHPALRMSPYAVMQQIKNYLTENLVNEGQPTKTGFVICPPSTAAQASLNSKIDVIQEFLSSQGQCIVEKPDNHTAYRLSGVPRSYDGYNGANIVMETIDAAVVAEALADLIKVAPINVLQSRGSNYTEYSPTKI
ncbi:hypothetical protein K3495_g3163 [Podosphaera aphanis]|nr:hypothetical protein K3495_g3163 [Podosphaera aphanis]